ncbi:MAG: hypothetical protein M0R28_21070 [Pigmentiphaga sp.]|nr:hypothetical protein [Pigmentiphaga sp.]
MSNPNARISRVNNSWRVRVFGHAPQFFADSEYGGTEQAIVAARAWRDQHWDGVDRSRKLTPAQREEISKSTEHYKAIADRYGIAPNYVHQLRRGKP